MVTIHDKKSNNFNTLGLGALLPSSCIVTEELNGSYELKMEHPYDPDGKWKRIAEENVILASTPRGMQPFRIYRVHPDMGRISVYARHIFYDLLDNGCINIVSKGTTAKAIMKAIQTGLLNPMPFTFETNITTSSAVEFADGNPVQMLLGDSETGSFVQTFGGEILRDGYRVAMQTSIGADRDVAIRYGKNLVGLEVDEDISNVKTRIICDTGRYREIYDSPYIDLYAFPKVHLISKFAWMSVLTKEAEAMLASGCDLPKVNIKVDFVELTKTEEYKDYAILEEVFLGDMVTIINDRMGFHKKAKVISYEWDCLLNRYGKIELGDFVTTIASSITSGMNSGSTAVNDASNVLAKLNEHIGNLENPHGVTAEQVGATGDSGDHVERAGDTMTGTLTIRHEDGLYIERTKDYNGTYKGQFSVAGGNKLVLNQWLNDVYTGGAYFGSGYLQIVDANKNGYRVFAENYLPTPDQIGAALKNHTHSEYAPADHSHSGYAPSDHTHSGYSTSDHGHTPSQVGVTQPWLDSNHSHSQQNIHPSAIELTPTGTGVGNGGYLDFHFNQDSGDYTARIIEAAKNRLDILASAGVRFNGHLYKTVNNAYWAILGGTASSNGASLYLYGKDATSDAGAFMLKATSGSTSKVLKGAIDGTLTWDGKDVWSANNKPMGTYTGNGSAASRTIAIGGKGSLLMLYYSSYVVFVGSGGGIALNFYDGSVVKFTSSEVKLSGGNMTIASTSQFLNQNGRVIGWLLL